MLSIEPSSSHYISLSHPVRQRRDVVPPHTHTNEGVKEESFLCCCLCPVKHSSPGGEADPPSPGLPERHEEMALLRPSLRHWEEYAAMGLVKHPESSSMPFHYFLKQLAPFKFYILVVSIQSGSKYRQAGRQAGNLFIYLFVFSYLLPKLHPQNYPQTALWLPGKRVEGVLQVPQKEL